ncbi:MAG: isoaspartyl peptidase/L-asparaginase [Candidatus Thermoplasmatota archaeon]|nr:isoaspartyl peptidase/L-asparaginase [Candidatus Thermoplasmatota archaeon]
MKPSIIVHGGACAIDTDGRVASATSTGGIPRKPAGRVGDSPLVGCGAYADGQAGAASATGWGEKIMAVLLAKTAIDALKSHGDPTEACREAVTAMRSRVDGLLGGIIMVDRKGTVGYHHNTPRMAFGFIEGNTGNKKVAIRV